MSPLRRLGDLVKVSEVELRGEHRILSGVDHLASKIFFPTFRSVEDYYIYSSPTIIPENFALPEGMTGIGEYEANLISKLLDPPNPVQVIIGTLGSGKSTTIDFIIKHILPANNCGHCLRTHHQTCQRMIAWMDCKQFADKPGSQISNGAVINQLCKEMRGRCGQFLTDEIEFIDYWNYIFKNYTESTDLITSNVAASLLAEDSSVRGNQEQLSATVLNRRKDLRDKLQKDSGWHINYMVLLWRFLIASHFNGRKDCGLIVLDNMDSLSPNYQSTLLDYIIRNSHVDGPTFILLMRPETFNRHSLNDILVDVTQHSSPDPIDVIYDRSDRFLANPKPYLDTIGGLSTEQKSIVVDYFSRMIPKMKDEKRFSTFIKASTGESIRNALVVAQDILNGVTLSEMRNLDLTTHYVIRACINHGNRQFIGNPKNRLDNPFEVIGLTEGFLLLKPRMLRFILGRGEKCRTALLLNAFALFGYSTKELIPAVNDLLRMEHQLLVSDGFDYFHETTGDDQETLHLTEVGKGYLDHLLFDVDFIQEVMLDTRVDSDEFPVELGIDRLEEKFTALYYFLRTLQRTDELEVRRFIRTHNARRYTELFGKRMLTLDILVKITPSIERILYSSARKYSSHESDYIDLAERFVSLVRVAENAQLDLLGVLESHYKPFAER